MVIWNYAFDVSDAVIVVAIPCLGARYIRGTHDEVSSDLLDSEMFGH